jgi:hypothetical protein
MATVTNSVQIALTAKGITATTKALGDLSKATTDFGNALTAITGSVAKFGAIITGAVTAAAGALGFVGFTAGLHDLLEFATEIDRAAEQTGASISKLVTLRSAFKAAGIEGKLLADSISKMQKEIGHAADTGLEAQAKFERLGLNFQELQELEPAAQFEAVATALANTEDKSLRASRSMDIFGKRSTQLIRVLDRVAESAGKGPSNFALIMERTAPTLHEIELILAALPAKARGFFAGFAEPFAKPVLDALKQLKNIDLSGAGQNVSNFILFLVDAWKKGNLGQIISLTFDAAFEQAEAYFFRFVNVMLTLFASPKFGNALSQGLLFGMASAVKATEQLWRLTVAAIKAYFATATDFWREKLEILVNELKIGLAEAGNVLIDGINKAITAANLVYSRSIPLIPPILIDPKPIAAAITFQEALNQELAKTTDQAKSFNALVDATTLAIAKALGIEVKLTDEVGKQLTATEKFLKLFNAFVEARNKLNKQPEDKPPAKPPTAPFNLEQNQLALKKQLYEIEQKRAALDADYSQTSAEKQIQRIALLKQEQKALKENADLLDLQAGAAEDSATALRLKTEAQQQRQQAGGVGNEVLRQGPPAESVSQNLIAEITNLRDQIGTVAQQIARSFGQIIRGGIDAASAGLAGLLKGTLTWKNALQEIGTSVFNTIIDSISRMFVEYITGKLLASAVTKETAAADTAALAGPALLTSVGSWGLAAIAGIAAFAVVMSMIGGFAQGGFTGPGNMNAPAGVVHRGEYVLPASDVRDIGLPQIEAFRADPSAFAGPQAQTTAPPINNEVNVYAFQSYDDAMKRWMESSEGRAVFVDMTRKTHHLVSR